MNADLLFLKGLTDLEYTKRKIYTLRQEPIVLERTTETLKKNYPSEKTCSSSRTFCKRSTKHTET